MSGFYARPASPSGLAGAVLDSGADGAGREDTPALPVVRLRAGRRESPAAVLADWQEVRVRTALGVQLRQTSRVRLVRPWWMPVAVQRWILNRLIRVDSAPVEAKRSRRSR